MLLASSEGLSGYLWLKPAVGPRANEIRKGSWSNGVRLGAHQGCRSDAYAAMSDTPVFLHTDLRQLKLD